MNHRLRREDEVLKRIDRLVRKKLRRLNLQLGATVAAAVLVVAGFGWTRTALLAAAMIVGVGNAVQGIAMVRMLPAHLRMNETGPASTATINRLSLWTEIAFVAIWIAVTAVLLWTAARAPEA